MRIVFRALDALMAVVPIHDQRDLVRDRGLAVVVLVPHDHDRRLLLRACQKTNESSLGFAEFGEGRGFRLGGKARTVAR